MKTISASSPRMMVLGQSLVILVAGLLLAVVVSNGRLSMVFGGAVALFLLGVFLIRPDAGLLAVLLVRASTDATATLTGESPAASGTVGLSANVGLILILILGGGVFVLSRGIPLLRLPGGRVLSLLLLTGLIGFLRADSIRLAANEWLPVVAAAVVYSLAAYFFNTPQRFQRLLDVVAVSSLVPVTFGYLQLVRGQGVSVEGFAEPRIYGTFVHPNPFGFYLVLLLAIFLSQALVRRGSSRKTMLLGLAVILPLLVFTFARVAWAGAVLVLLVVGLLRDRRILLVLPVLGLLAILAVPSVADRLSDPLGGSMSDRLNSLWPVTIREWRTATQEPSVLLTAVNRFAGLGPGAGLELTERGRGGEAPPHNDYLRVLYEYGIFGLVLFLILIGILIVSAIRAYRSAHDPTASAVALAFSAVVVAFAAMSLTDNVFGYTANQVYFWALAGLSAATSSVKQHTGRAASSIHWA